MAEQKKKLKDVLQAIYNAVKALVVQPDYAQNDSQQPDFIKNRTHYVESVSTSSVWNQSGCSVGSGTTSPGGYPATFNITTGNKYNVTISQGSNSKTYEGLTAEYDSVFNGLALRKNWSDSMGISDTSTDALLLVVQPSNVVLRSADIYGENCTVQVSEVTETIHKLDPKYLPDNVNQLDSITTSKSGKVTTVTFEQTNGTETQFQVTDGEDGKSAYQVAVDNGYSGTEAQWLASLKGADGVSLGEVELVQQLSQDDDKVPSAKAVQDGIKVWRDDANIAYSADNVVLNGSNYIDTGVELFNYDKDFYLYMELSSVNLATSGIVVSCRNYTTNAGFDIKRTTTSGQTRLYMYLVGYNRFGQAYTPSGKTVIVFKKEGDLFTFSVNGGAETLTNTIEQISAETLWIGAKRGSDGNPTDYGAFTIDKIRLLVDAKKGGQLYTDFTKRLHLYPLTTVAAIDGFSDVLNAQYFNENIVKYKFADYPDLSPTKSDKITILYDKRYRANYNNENTEIIRFQSIDRNNYFYVSINSYQTYYNFKKNGGSNVREIGGSTPYGTDLLFAMSIDFTAGTIQEYGNGALRKSLTFNVNNMPDLDSLEYLTMGGTSNGRQLMAVFNGVLNASEVLDVCNSYPNLFAEKYRINAFGYKVLSFTSATTSSFASLTKNDTEVTVNSNATSGATGGQLNIAGIRNVAYDKKHQVEYKVKLSVTSGEITVQALGTWWSGYNHLRCEIYDANGNLLGVGSGAGALSVGEYTCIFRKTIPTIYSDGYTSCVFTWTCTSAATFTLSDYTVTNIGAPLIIHTDNYRGRYFEQPNGENVPVTDGIVVGTDVYKPQISTLAYPQYTGQMRVDDNGNWYIGNINNGNTGTWKQINNS